MKEMRLINKFSEKILILENGSFWAQKLCILITLDLLEEFFLNFAQSEGLIGKVDENNFNNFPKKNLSHKWHILTTLDPL